MGKLRSSWANILVQHTWIRIYYLYQVSAELADELNKKDTFPQRNTCVLFAGNQSLDDINLWFGHTGLRTLHPVDLCRLASYLKPAV